MNPIVNQLIISMLNGVWPQESPEARIAIELVGPIKHVVNTLGDAQYINEICIPQARILYPDIKEYFPILNPKTIATTIRLELVEKIDEYNFRLTAKGIELWDHENFNNRPNGWTSSHT